MGRFKSFRESRILVAGSGMAFRTLATALLRNGLKHLVLACCVSEREHLGQVHAEAARLQEQGVEAGVSITDPADRQLADPAPREFSVVAFVSDGGALDDISRLCRRCQDNGIAFLPALFFAGQSWIGPYSIPARPGCWMCAILRMSANLEPAAQSALWQGMALGGAWSPRARRACLPLSRMVGNALAFEIFKARAGHLPHETDRAVLIQQLDTLETARAAFLPHPLCPVCSSVDPDAAPDELEDFICGRRDLSAPPERRTENTPGLVDDRAGIFRGFDDSDAVQLPLYTTRLQMSAVTGSDSPPPAVRAVSQESLRAAREKGLRAGAKRYADSVPEPRRMVHASIEQLLARGTPFRAAEELSTWSGGPTYEPHEVIAWMPAQSLMRREAVLVPAASVYPQSELNDKGVFEAGSGAAGAGATFDQVSREAICSALTYERICDTVRGVTKAFTLNLDHLAAVDPYCAYLASVLSRYEVRVGVYELGQEGPVRVVVAEAQLGDSHAGPLRWIGSGLSGTEAAGNALLELVGDLQNAEAGNHSALGDRLLMGISLPAPAEANDLDFEHYAEPGADVPSALESLIASGREPLFCDMTPTDLQGIVLIGKFLLTTAGPAESVRSDPEDERADG